jgi:hypothetical protein
MALPGALILSLALAAARSGDDRLLLCRPQLLGDPALARGESLLAAGKASRRFLDYGVVCDGAAESARAARRVGLRHAVSASAEGRVDGSRYVLVVADAAADAEGEVERARRTLEVAPGADAVRPLRAALAELAASLPPGPGPEPAHVAGWSVAAVGAAALAAGAAFTLRARDAAARANAAPDVGGHVRATDDWRRRRSAAAILFASGGAALAAGLTWRFAF